MKKAINFPLARVAQLIKAASSMGRRFESSPSAPFHTSKIVEPRRTGKDVYICCSLFVGWRTVWRRFKLPGLDFFLSLVCFLAVLCLGLLAFGLAHII